MTKNKSEKLGKWSMFLSLVCAVHCMAMPLLIAFLSVAGLSFLNSPILEGITLMASSGLAGYVILSNQRFHGQILPIFLFGISLVILVPAFIIHSHLFIALGSMFTAGAVFSNWYFRKNMCAC